MTIGVKAAGEICARIAGVMALWQARPKDPPPVDFGRLADELQQVVDTLRARSQEGP